VDLTLHLFASAGAGDWRTVGLVVDLVLAARPDRSPYSGTPQVYRCTRLGLLSNHIAVSSYHRNTMCCAVRCAKAPSIYLPLYVYPFTAIGNIAVLSRG
jgi:hypothetical protein